MSLTSRPACAMGARAADPARRWLSLEQHRSLLAMADQGIASLGNFTTTILLARALSREEYGAFGLILEAVLFFNAIQAALVTYPLSVKGATSNVRGLGRLTTVSLSVTGAIGLLITMFTLVAGVLHGRIELALCASAALVMWQIQETLRRALISHLRYDRAIFGDAVSYLCQAALVALLVFSGAITIERTFLIIALTSAAGAVVQIVQVKPRLVPLTQIIRQAGQFLTYGRWQALNNATVIITGMSYFWVLAFFHGTAAVGEFYALAIMLKLTNPLISGIGGLLLAASAKAYDVSGARAAWHIAARYAWIGAAVLIPYFLALILFPTWSIRLVHGSQSLYADRANLLRVLVAAAALTYAVSAISAFLNGIHRSHQTLRAQLMNVVVSLIIGIPLMIVGGLFAGTIGMVAAVAAQLVLLIRSLNQARGGERAARTYRDEPPVAARIKHGLVTRPLPAAA